MVQSNLDELSRLIQVGMCAWVCKCVCVCVCVCVFVYGAYRWVYTMYVFFGVWCVVCGLFSYDIPKSPRRSITIIITGNEDASFYRAKRQRDVGWV